MNSINGIKQNRSVSMADAYDMFLKQMGGRVSTLNPDPCDKNCQNTKCLLARKTLRYNNQYGKK